MVLARTWSRPTHPVSQEMRVDDLHISNNEAVFEGADTSMDILVPCKAENFYREY